MYLTDVDSVSVKNNFFVRVSIQMEQIVMTTDDLVGNKFGLCRLSGGQGYDGVGGYGYDFGYGYTTGSGPAITNMGYGYGSEGGYGPSGYIPTGYGIDNTGGGGYLLCLPWS